MGIILFYKQANVAEFRLSTDNDTNLSNLSPVF